MLPTDANLERGKKNKTCPGGRNGGGTDGNAGA